MALGAIDDAMECLSGAVSSVVAAPSVSVWLDFSLVRGPRGIVECRANPSIGV
jgi:hypothetical protein